MNGICNKARVYRHLTLGNNKPSDSHKFAWESKQKKPKNDQLNISNRGN